MPKLLCIGDSITYGAWDSKGGWVARLRERVDKICIDSDLEQFYLTYNLGISSDTTERLLQRFDGDVAPRMIEEGEPYFIFSIGTNDAIRATENNQPWVGQEEFESNLRQLIAKAKKHSKRIVFLGNLPVDEAKTKPYRDDPTLSSSNEDIRAYEQATQRVCEEENVDFIPVFEGAMASEYNELLFNDGVHPNDAGHALLADRVWEYVSSNGWVS